MSSKIWGDKGSKEDAPPPPAETIKQAPVRPNKETYDAEAEVNPHNEALAQRPVENAEEKLQEAGERWERSKWGKWKDRVFLGGPRQADWEEFDALLAEEERTRPARKAAAK